jgi:membrane fusion protein (multidrug efflux system)
MKYLILLAAIAFAACSKSEAATQSKAETTAPVTEVFPLSEGVLDSSLRIPGELIAFERVDLYAKTSSFVQKLFVDVGSEVKQGQLLALLEAPEVRSQLAEAESQLAAQRAAYGASKALYDRLVETAKTPGTVSKNDLEQAEARVNGDEARLKAAQSAREAVAALESYLEMRAPFAGVISARNVSTGAYVGPAGRGSEYPLFTLQQQNLLRLVVSVPEANIGYLVPGSEVAFTVKSRPGQKFVAKVARMAGALDTRLRAERIEMNVANEDKRLLPGMVAEVSVPMAGTEARYVVPKSAVVRSTLGSFVVRLQDAKARWAPVQLGREVGDKVEIYGDLSKGEMLARIATEELRDGTPLQQTKVVSP